MKEEMNIKRGGGRIRGKISSYKHVLSKRGDKTFESDIRTMVLKWFYLF